MSGFYSLKIANIRRETADSVSICFDVPKDLAERFVFRPGQHLTVRQQINGDDVRRNYSVCAAPHENELRIAVKQVAGGVFSTWANTALQAGAVIDVMSPHGSFTWKFEAGKKRRYVCFAGGSGITAVTDILRMSSVPVIFVTAYPERLLTGERPEPAFLITKPFEPETLDVAISQALAAYRG